MSSAIPESIRGEMVLGVLSGERLREDDTVYAPLILQLRSRRLLSIEPGNSAVIVKLPADARDETLESSAGATPVGRTIVDVLTDEKDPEVLVVLSGGHALRHYYLPDGSHYAFDAVDEIGEETMWKSLISEKKGQLRELAE